MSDVQAATRATPRKWSPEEVGRAEHLRNIEKLTFAQIGHVMERPLGSVKATIERYRGRELLLPSRSYAQMSAPPDSVIKEREERLKAMDRRDLSASIFGDPPPGYSALDKQLGCYAHE